MNLRDVLKYGVLGLLCGGGAVLGYSIASSVVPLPFPYSAESEPTTVSMLISSLLLAGIVAVAFFSLYGLLLSLIQVKARRRAPSPSQLLAIGICAALMQAAASFAADAFTRTRPSWNLDQSISIPILIVGATLPGLITAGVLLLKR